jgi:hypothetical protein
MGYYSNECLEHIAGEDCEDRLCACECHDEELVEIELRGTIDID